MGSLLQRNQHGFSAIEAVLTVLLVLAIGAAGFFAYQAHQNNGQKAVSSTQPQSTSSQPATKPANEYDVKELGIKLTLPSGLSASDLTYQASTTSQVNSDANGKSLKTIATADFSTKSLIAAGGLADDGTQACLPSVGPFGQVQLLDADPTGYVFGSGPSLIKKIGSNYLGRVGPQSPCSQNSQAQQLLTQQGDLFDQALKTAQPLN